MNLFLGLCCYIQYCVLLLLVLLVRDLNVENIFFSSIIIATLGILSSLPFSHLTARLLNISTVVTTKKPGNGVVLIESV